MKLTHQSSMWFLYLFVPSQVFEWFPTGPQVIWSYVMLSLPHLCWLHGYTPWLGVITLVMRGILAGAVASTHLWLDEERQSQQRNLERG